MRRSRSPAAQRLVQRSEKYKSICSVIEAQFDIRKVHEELATFKLIFMTILQKLEIPFAGPGTAFNLDVTGLEKMSGHSPNAHGEKKDFFRSFMQQKILKKIADDRYNDKDGETSEIDQEKGLIEM